MVLYKNAQKGQKSPRKQKKQACGKEKER